MKFSVILVMLGLLAACGSSRDEKAEGVIPEHMIESMDKAENVEDVLQQAEQQRREQAESN